MSCTSCKKKKSFIEEKEELLSGFNSSAIGFAIIWSVLALYGLYYLIITNFFLKTKQFVYFEIYPYINTRVKNKYLYKKTNMSKWYVIKVMPGKERQLSEQFNTQIGLGKIGFIDRFVCPMEKEFVVLRKKKVSREKIIYNGYLYFMFF